MDVIHKIKSTIKLLSTLALFCVTQSSFASMYTFDTCKFHAVSIPCEHRAWDVGFTLIYGEATPSDKLFVLDSTPVTTPYWGTIANYEFSYGVEARYHFSSGNDITVNWETAHAGLHGRSLSSTSTLTTVGNFVFSLANEVFAEHDIEFDEVNGEFGQHIDVGEYADVRIHGGLQYAKIDYLKEWHGDFGSVGGAERRIEYHSEFEGLGARVGTDLVYDLDGGFSTTASTAIALLVSNIDTHGRVYDSTNTVLNGFNFESKVVVVPSAWIRIGFAYLFDWYKARFEVNGGWYWKGYYSALRFYQGPGTDYESFMTHGPFVGIKYVG